MNCVILRSPRRPKNLSVIIFTSHNIRQAKTNRLVKTYHVYTMASASRVLYIGVTGDLLRRVSEHKQKKVPASPLATM
jgi:hypothetical protein